jgi:quercetin dioxygenase-like cupin family protein
MNPNPELNTEGALDMTLGVPRFDPLIVALSDMRVFGFSGASTALVADSDATGALSAMRTTIGPGAEAVPPHFHKTAAEFFYVLAGTLQLLVADQVVTLPAGNAAAVPPYTAYALGTAPDHTADVFIAQAPGISRAAYFRLVERLAAGEAAREELLATQDRYDNHFLESQEWSTARTL